MTADTESHSDTPSGQQYRIAHGASEATITEVGAMLRSLRVAGHDLVAGFTADTMPDGARGQVLIPWPNRLADGRYSFGGQEQQLPVNETARQTAIHGLVRTERWQLVEQAEDRVTLGYTMQPQPGYPFTLAVQVTYALVDAGLEVITTARNVGDQSLPFGAGFHPYFTVGTPTINDTMVQVPSAWALLTDERLIPYDLHEVAGTNRDFRSRRQIGDTVLDGCYTRLERDAAGWATVELSDLTGQRVVRVLLDPSFDFVQMYSGDHLANQSERRDSLAIEPMTCAPDAFNNQRGLVELAPGEAWRGIWKVQAGG